MANICVMLAMPTTRDLPVKTLVSLWATQKLLITRGIAPVICIPTGCSTGAFDGRNVAAHQFLGMPECTHLFQVDSDMSWQADDFLRILALCTKLSFVAAAYPLKRDDQPVFACNVKEGTPIVPDEFGCVEVNNGVGLGFACVQRHVMEELAAKAPLVKMPGRDEKMRHIFRCELKGDELVGEDYVFCQDIMSLGYPVKIDPHIALGHIGPKEFHHGSVSQTWKPIHVHN